MLCMLKGENHMLGILTFILFLVVVISIIKRHKADLGKLTKLQLSGGVASFLIAILIAFICIYYIGNYITDYIHHRVLRTIVEVLIIIVTLSFCRTMLWKALHKITKGIFPKGKL